MFKSLESQIRLASHEVSHFDEIAVTEKDLGPGGVAGWYAGYVEESMTTEDPGRNNRTEQTAYGYEDVISFYLHREFEGEENYILNTFNNKDLSDEDRARRINTAFAFWNEEEGEVMKFNQTQAEGSLDAPIKDKQQRINPRTGARSTLGNGSPQRLEPAK